MIIKGNVDIHNRFDIEVRNIKTNSIDKYVAYNLITDKGLGYAMEGKLGFRMNNITIGSGAVAPNASKSKLNAPIGQKGSTVEEVVTNAKDGVGYKKVKVVLNPSDFNGTTIREIGIGSTAEASTHALLQDSEGNVISIEKTDTDEITIYATLYVKGEMGNGSVISVESGVLYENLTTTSNSSTGDSMRVAQGGHIAKRESATMESNIFSKQIGYREVERDYIQFIRSHKMRFELNEANFLINSIGTNSCRIGLLESDYWDGMYWEGTLGVGDGVTKAFDTSFHTIDSLKSGNAVKVDGANKNAIITDVRQDISMGNLLKDYGEINPYPYFTDGSYGFREDELILEFETYNAVSVKGLNATAANGRSFKIKVLYSSDGTDYIESGIDGKFTRSGNTLSCPPTPKVRFFKIVGTEKTDPATNIYNISFIFDIPDKQIVLEEAPAENELVTGKIWCNGIPKDENHIIDITIDFKFRDGGKV